MNNDDNVQKYEEEIIKLGNKLDRKVKYAQNNKDTIIAIGGCMMQESLVVEKIKKSYRHVDIITSLYILSFNLSYYHDD